MTAAAQPAPSPALPEPEPYSHLTGFREDDPDSDELVASLACTCQPTSAGLDGDWPDGPPVQDRYCPHHGDGNPRNTIAALRDAGWKVTRDD